MKRSLFVSIIVLVFLIQFGWTSEIHKAAEEGNLVEVKRLLSETPNRLDEKDERGSTPLLIATLNGKKEVVEYLVAQGADIKAVNMRGNTALHLAAYGGSPDLVEYFLAKGFDVNSKSLTGLTPLIYSIMAERPEVVKLLLAKGADITIADSTYGGSAIHWACNRKNAEIREMLLSIGADLNAISLKDGASPIFWATFAGNNDALIFLLDHGVNANSVIRGEATPLQNAIWGGRVEIVRTLLARGAALNGIIEGGETPLMSVVSMNSDSLIDVILDAGADVNRSDSTGFAPIHFAAMYGNMNILRKLIAKGADIKKKTRNEYDPLSYAVMRGHAEVAKLLIDNGVTVKVEDLNRNGCQPLREAFFEGYDSIITMIFNYPIDLNQKDSAYGRTVLHWTAIKGDKAGSELLIQKGAKINEKDNAGFTPLYYAGKYGHRDVAEFLKTQGGVTRDVVENDKSPLETESIIKPGEAQVYYLGHCGYAIKTTKHFLIFDYNNTGRIPTYPGLVNGHINPSEIAGENVYVFVTHDHSDHYDSSIFGWKNTIKNIKYIYGFDPSSNRQIQYSGPEFTYVAPHENKTIDDITIKTIAANDAGVGFLVEVDGLTIYHAGDHAGWAAGQRDGYIKEIDYLAGLTSNIDLAFLNATGCHSHDPVALAEGTYYTLNKLKPNAWIPTHGLNNEAVYGPFVKDMERRGSKVKAICSENRGDSFEYRK
jgi:ankyrin repeat protein/L-ascorbate metabolism protein UlaG (beta-lactamase superfamily)